VWARNIAADELALVFVNWKDTSTIDILLKPLWPFTDSQSVDVQFVYAVESGVSVNLTSNGLLVSNLPPSGGSVFLILTGVNASIV